MHNFSLKKILVGTGVALVLSLIFVAILTLVVYFGDLKESTVSTLVLVLSVVSVAVGAFILARNIAGGGLLNGLVLGAVYCLVLVVLSLLMEGSVAFDFHNLTRILIILAGSMLGGVLGINSAK